MIQPDKPIICPGCHKDTGYTEKGLSMYVVPTGGLKCKNCGHTFIRGRDVRLALAWSR